MTKRSEAADLARAFRASDREVEADNGVPEELATWLESLDTVEEAKPIRLRIFDRVWDGAEYWASPNPRDENPTPAERRYYFLGELPPSFRRGNVAYRLNGSDVDWFVAGYYGQKGGRGIVDQEGQSNEWHPFGAMFQLFAWDVPDGEAIDEYEAKPYKRVAGVVATGVSA